MSDEHGDAVSGNRAWPDRAIAALAARQAANVGHAQLRGLGIAPSTIAAALARGRLHPVHHGVHSLVPPGARPALAAEHAALLACGPQAVISHETAAALHGLRLPGSARDDDVHVTMPGHGRGRSRPRVHAHRTRELQRGERVRIGRLPVTSIARTVIDLTPQLGDRQRERLVDQALGRISRDALLAAVDLHPHRPGAGAVRRLLESERPSSDTWSHAEERLFLVLRRAGVPAPEANVAIGRYIPDLQWREYRVLVEYQSRDHHSSERARLDDARRHNDLTSWGYTVLHVTRRDLRRPERMLVWIVAALTHNGWAPGA